MEHKFVLFSSSGAIISAGIRAAYSFPPSYVVGVRGEGGGLIIYKNHGEGAKREQWNHQTQKAKMD